MSDEFEAEAWIERLAVALRGLCEAQGSFLEEYWRYNPRHYVEFDGRDETPFPLDDLAVNREGRPGRSLVCRPSDPDRSPTH